MTDNLPMRLLPTEIMSGAPVRSRDISLGDDPGINGQLWDVNRIDITAQQGTGALDGTRRYAAVVPY